ncbi:MAG: hypothetical protein CL698_01470 [Chloroflexi bacterium]|nr:hypothetical protein [Chloroflexota bacterium]MQG00907.1 SAP domain-containing protein [SAR202 cluster bacterium]|tara:strand:- start:881 stop:1096 length:216 start_codon:yes stop_codon:yes gene_type:complete
MNIDKLLVECRSDDLAHALRELGLPVTGTKPQRIERLVQHHAGGGATSDILGALKPEDLRRAAKAIKFEGA